MRTFDMTLIEACDRAARDSDLTAGGGRPLLGEQLRCWRIASVVGSGAMGTVYRAFHRLTGADVAVKVLSSDHAGDRCHVNRFQTEPRLMARINHPNVVTVFDVATLEDGRPCYVMELVHGLPLAELIARDPHPPIDRAAALLQGVLAGLAAAHARGVVHRDVKPSNVLVTDGGVPKLSDFGVATLGSAPARAFVSPAGAGGLLGTPAYLAPEQAAGMEDERSDLYSLGVTMYQVLCGRLPFMADSVHDLVRMHQEIAPAPPSVWRDDIPPSLDTIVLRALAKSPDDRFQSAADMAADWRLATTMTVMRAKGRARRRARARARAKATRVTVPIRRAPSRSALVAIASLVAVASVLAGWFLVRATIARGDGPTALPPAAALLGQTAGLDDTTRSTSR